MLEIWSKCVDSWLKDCDERPNPLSGITVRVRHSRQLPYSNFGQAFEQLLVRYGATPRRIDDLSFTLASEAEKGILSSIDAFIMMAATTGVSAEALELSHVTCVDESLARKKLHVAMPADYDDGFIYKRLKFHDVSVDLYNSHELDNGVVCIRAIDKLLERKRAEETLEKAKAREFDPKIGIVTALPIEHQAIVDLLENPRFQRIRTKAGKLEEYVHGTLPAFDGGDHRVVVTRLGVGNNISAAMTERLFNTFDLDEVFMVGIAGGIPRLEAEQPDVRFGDVVVSGRGGVVQYDMKKATPAEDVQNFPPRPPSPTWLHRAQTFMNSVPEMTSFVARLSDASRSSAFKRPAATTDKLYDDSDPKNPISVRRPRRKAGDVQVFEGLIGSANIVVKDQILREELRKNYGLLAVEMEGSGVADASLINGKPFFVIRGICDYANTGKNKIWQPFAAKSAAVFAAMLIESMPLAKK